MINRLASKTRPGGYTVSGMRAGGGTFTLTLDGQTTAAISFNATAPS